MDISQEQAIQIALERVSGATEADVRIELDYDDGKYKYEGDIIHEQREYEFEIDANTGTILEWGKKDDREVGKWFSYVQRRHMTEPLL